MAVDGNRKVSGNGGIGIVDHGERKLIVVGGGDLLGEVFLEGLGDVGGGHAEAAGGDREGARGLPVRQVQAGGAQEVMRADCRQSTFTTVRYIGTSAAFTHGNNGSQGCQQSTKRYPRNRRRTTAAGRHRRPRLGPSDSVRAVRRRSSGRSAETSRCTAATAMMKQKRRDDASTP